MGLTSSYRELVRGSLESQQKSLVQTSEKTKTKTAEYAQLDISTFLLSFSPSKLFPLLLIIC